MTGWKVHWKDHDGKHHETSYSSMAAVLDHVGHCLKKGMSIGGIHKMHSGEHARCIFRIVRQVNMEHARSNKDRVLEIMRRDGSIIVTDLMNILDLPYRSEPMKRAAIRTMLYQMADKGIIEPIKGSRPTRWKLTESIEADIEDAENELGIEKEEME